MTSNSVSFFLNGQRQVVHDPSPRLLLIDFLRSPEIGLAGPKKPCGQGGCGGCTVILSRWNADGDHPEHRAINPCLRPVCALDGLSVTTIEGTGGVARGRPERPAHAQVFSRMAPQSPMQTPHIQKEMAKARAHHENLRRAAGTEARNQAEGVAPAAEARIPQDRPDPGGMNPVAYRLAANNGSQCGYCSVGFVMNMSEFIANNPKATKREIEQAFDGNLCRCTGYRPILTGMKSFASDWTEADARNRMKCKLDSDAGLQRPLPSVNIPFPLAAKAPARPVDVKSEGKRWTTPADLARLIDEMRMAGKGPARLVHANTSFGIYKDEYVTAADYLDIREIAELNAPPHVTPEAVRLSAGTTYSDLIAFLEGEMTKQGLTVEKKGETFFDTSSALGVLHHMAMRTAGRIVRNAATIGGNLMLVLHHIEEAEPFPSDLATAMVGVGADVEFIDIRRGNDPEVMPLQQLIKACRDDPDLAASLVLLAFILPKKHAVTGYYPHKVALREVNSHSLVNATTHLGPDGAAPVLVFAGIAPYPWRARQTEALIAETGLSLAAIPKITTCLETEVLVQLEMWAERMEGLPSEGISDRYKAQLAVSFLYKSIIAALISHGRSVPSDLSSAAEMSWGRWPVSDGHQSWKSRSFEQPVGEPFIKGRAMEQASGQIHYAHELPVPPNTAYASLVQSQRALSRFAFTCPGVRRKVKVADLRDHLRDKFPDFVDIMTSDDFGPGQINLQGMGSDQPIFAEEEVSYIGQTIALIAAKNAQAAEDIAAHVEAECIHYEATQVPADAPDWWHHPVLSLEQAIAVGSIYPDWPSQASFISHIWRITRPGSKLDWVNADEDPLDRTPLNEEMTLDGVPCRLVGQTQQVGGQIHFYMEPQAAIAEPVDSHQMVLRPSSQSPMEMHQTAAMATGMHYNRIDVQIPPVGGGFGGKTEQARFVTGAAAKAADAIRRPVKLALTREQDTAMIGKRHGYYGQTRVAIDKGELDPEDRGLLRGFVTRLWGDGGAFYDCSFIVSNCIQTRIDNAYRIPNFQSQIDVCRTNTAPSTAFRSFGDIQGKLIVESAIEDAAYAVGMTGEEVRAKNLYQRGDVTPFGQALSFCYIREVWDYLKTQCGYAAKLKAVEDFNAANKWRKRGIAMMPVKYGSGYNLTMLEQATAMLSIYQADGTVIIHQGGVEMGQGLLTQVRQIASYVLNIPQDMIIVEAAKTSVIPNPISTGGSTGTAYNGEAVKQLCGQMRDRLLGFAQDMRTEHGDKWCAAQGIDYWNHGAEGWQACSGDGVHLVWQKIVALAHTNRIGLTATFTAPIRGGEVSMPNVTYKPHDQQPHIPGYTVDPDAHGGGFDNFVGFTYAAAVSVVEVDVLTGESKVISSDIAYDMGWSLNPAIDIGQVEGAFVQGIGLVLSEKLAFQQTGDEAGRLNTLNTWRYKVPATTSIPLEMNVHLFPRDLAEVPPSPTDGVLSSKEVGEPPLVLATSVFLALRNAVRASRVERGLPWAFNLDAPATVDAVRDACEVDLTQLNG